MNRQCAFLFLTCCSLGAAIVYVAESPLEPLDPARDFEPSEAVAVRSSSGGSYDISTNADFFDYMRRRSDSGGSTESESESETGADWIARLSAAQTIVPETRRSDALSDIYSDWAFRDPAGLYAHLSTLNVDLFFARRVLGNALRLAAESDPEFAISISDRFRGSIGEVASAAAFEALAAEDPDLAIGRLPVLNEGASADLGEQRGALLEAIAQGFARYDLNAAVDWLGALDASDSAAFNPVVEALAAVNLARAIELDAWAMSLDLEGDWYGSVEWLVSSSMSDLDAPAAIAQQLVDTRNTGLLATIVRRWSVDDPFGAIGWMNVQDALHSAVIGAAASEVAHRGLDDAIALAPSLDPVFRPAWIEASLETGAAYGVNYAFSLLDSYRDQPFYDAARADLLAEAIFQLGPERVAGMTGSTPPRFVATSIARKWAAHAPLAAANWAEAIDDSVIRRSARNSVSYAWIEQDVAAVADWARGLSDPELREQMINTVCLRTPDCRPVR